MVPLAALEGIASQYSGTPTSISCDAPATLPLDSLGYVHFVDGKVVAVIHLPRATCASLEHLDDGAFVVPLDVLTLTHEATHIQLNSPNECVVERTALANAWQFVRRFGLSARRARWIMDGLPNADAQIAAPHACRVAS